ncbi:oligosaccharide flippase family protein [Phocaeicola dorei]|uniref:oligosaccharide flippase family protein n=1 Tax=Phocaeicola dorei TaxID=357276 RepID=UPI00189FD104|nr:oligosaccharide flippase family protein [Phocaeicola dorei]
MASYSSIIKSTGLVGLAQVFKLFFGLLQSKILAVLVGTAGFGVWSLFNTFVQTVSSFSTLGIDQAGIRQVSKNSENTKLLGESIYVFRTLLLFLSMATVLLICIFRKEVSLNLLGNEKYSWSIVIVSLAIFLNGLSQGCMSVLNGLRKLKEMVKSQIAGYSVGMIGSVIFVLAWDTEGISWFIFASSLSVFILSYYYFRKQKLAIAKVSFRRFYSESKVLFPIGIAIAYSALIVAVSTYMSQVYIRQKFGLEWVGIYNASNTISSVYINVFLSAMGVDLMPRLAKLINQEKAMGRLICDQMELGVLASTIGIIAVLLFAPLIIQILYTSEFLPATNVMRWHILSVSLKVLSYPMSYAVIVRQKTWQYIAIQTLLWGGSYVLLILFTRLWGTSALGANFLFAFVIYIIFLFILNRRLLIISPLLKKLLAISWGMIIALMVLNEFFPPVVFHVLGGVLLIADIAWIFYVCRNYMGIDIVALIKQRLHKNKNK